MQEHPVILFDGVCNYCNSVVNFIIRHDKKNIFRFAALQSDAAKKLLEPFGFSTQNLDTFLLIHNGCLYSKSTAALRLYNQLPWYWKWTQIFWIVPKFLRDAVYSIFANNRYKWFGKKEQCMIPGVEIRSRFIN